MTDEDPPQKILDKISAISPVLEEMFLPGGYILFVTVDNGDGEPPGALMASNIEMDNALLVLAAFIKRIPTSEIVQDHEVKPTVN